MTVRRIIVGAGGFGREVLHWARAAWPDHAPLFAGFLSAEAGIPSENDCPLPIVADPAAFDPQSGDALVLVIGIPAVRRCVAEHLLARILNDRCWVPPRLRIAGACQCARVAILVACEFAVAT